jgi:hypothetical protein
MIPYNVDIIPQVGFMTSCLGCISMLLFISHIVDGYKLLLECALIIKGMTKSL